MRAVCRPQHARHTHTHKRYGALLDLADDDDDDDDDGGGGGAGASADGAA